MVRVPDLDTYDINRRAHRVTDGIAIHNKLNVVKTTISDASASKIELPENAEDVIIYHTNSSAILYIGGDNSITTVSESAPVKEWWQINLRLKSGNDNELYGISSSGDIMVYAIATYKE